MYSHRQNKNGRTCLVNARPPACTPCLLPCFDCARALRVHYAPKRCQTYKGSSRMRCDNMKLFPAVLTSSKARVTHTIRTTGRLFRILVLQAHVRSLLSCFGNTLEAHKTPKCHRRYCRKRALAPLWGEPWALGVDNWPILRASASALNQSVSTGVFCLPRARFSDHDCSPGLVLRLSGRHFPLKKK